ncbi:TonB-dependent receptor [Sphingobium amiense]|uniref:TonB-dependent receptor n=1 Tax=Sphingobium amiense TaxID=135719 RepID=A0A494WF15_9SPHN|nr:TonB-dependent receptor [Sphingobium amiense]BBD99139.1 TonB-dependent receptor [Sphingobium amiense]
MEQDKKRGYIGFCDTSVVPGEARARRFRGRSAKSLFLIAAQASSALLMAGAAHAQTAAASRANDDPEIVVTAQKRSEKLTEVPLAMSVIQAADLAKRGAASLADIAAYMPGVAISNGGAPGQNGVVIRGLATSYNNSFNAPLVVTYIDDQPTGASAGGFGGARGGAYTLDLMPYDIEKVEVLRGPQGTLYGANAMGGILKYSLKRPDLTNIEAQAGGEIAHVASASGLDWGVRGAINLPVVTDKLGLRVSIYNRETAGYIDNIGIGRKNSNSTQTIGGRVAALFVPTERLSIEASALFQRITSDDSTAVTLVGQTGVPAYGRYVRSTKFPETYRQRAQNYALKIDWDLDFATLTSSTSYASMKYNQQIDLSGIPYVPSAPTALIPYIFNNSVKKFTQETRLASPNNETFTWMVGSFFTREKPHEYNDFRAYSAYDVPLPAPNNILLLGTTPGSRNTYTEWGAFANGTFRFSEKFDIGAGLRYGENRSRGCDEGFTGIYGNGGTYACQTRPWDGVTTWMVNARYHFQPDAMIYGRIATGYRPGGGCDTCGNPLLGVPPTYDPDRLTNYELGVKGLFLDRRLQFELSAFYIDWTDIQLRVTNSQGFSYPGNGDTAVSKGVELNSSYSFRNGLKLGGFVTYTDAKLTAPAPGVGGKDGDQLPGSARWAAAAMADYAHEIGNGLNGVAGIAYRYKDKVNSQLAGTGQPFPMGAQNIVDIYGGVELNGTSVRLYAKNLFNDRSYTGLTFLTDRTRPLFIPVQPFTVGLQIDHSF